MDDWPAWHHPQHIYRVGDRVKFLHSNAKYLEGTITDIRPWCGKLEVKLDNLNIIWPLWPEQVEPVDDQSKQTEPA